ncbi:hypothetical protein [Novacetimonas hansenii]|uniref:Uncharacterized protein n=1 Tax=Novacetimonas hansenii TaxID=436 RepID=A0AAW5EKT7_NOVHA|nr:hypothetical protein [Novacetimonas hansenii]MCJ8352479.1 hypothetical protein [Novacetimonas hansenii]
MPESACLRQVCAAKNIPGFVFWLLGKTGPETRLNHKSLEGNCLSGKIWHHKLYGFLSVIIAKQLSVKPQFLEGF